MNRQHALWMPCFVLASLCQIGCAMDAGGDEAEDISQTQQDAMTSNGLTSNGLTSNGLTSNGLTSNGLTSNGLTSNSLVMNTLISDPKAREVLSYIVSCALPANDYIDLTINGTPQRYYGGLGIAPEWHKGAGSCNEACQFAVSSCVMARVNYLGQQVEISMRGGPTHLGPDNRQELNTYTEREAAYFGNIFRNPEELFFCLPAGEYSLPRVCGPFIYDCALKYVGSCNCAVDNNGYGEYDICDFPGHPDVSPITVFLRP